jgi:hypothetical protein
MDNNKIATIVSKIAKEVISYEFPTQKALKEYLKEHPKADKSLHKVVKQQLKEQVKKQVKPVQKKPLIKKPIKKVMAPTKNKPVEKTQINDPRKEPKKNIAPKITQPQEKTVSKGHQKSKVKAGSLDKVKNILQANKIKENSDELQEMAGFKKTLGQRVPESDYGKYFVRNESKLKADFIKNMNLSNYKSKDAFKNAKARIEKMPTGDFGKLLSHIVSEEDEL